MHRALILSSYYGADSGYPNHVDWQRIHHVSRRFAAAGYAVETLASGPGLVEALRQKLRVAQPHESVLIYFSGYVLVHDAQPALLLADGAAAPLRLSQLAARAGASYGRVLFVVDGVLGSPVEQVEGEDEQPPEARVCALTLNGIEPDNVSALVSIRPWGASPTVSFSDALSETLGRIIETGAAADSVQLMHALHRLAIESHHIGLSETDPNFMVVPQRKFQSNPAVASPSAIISINANPDPLPKDRLSQDHESGGREDHAETLARQPRPLETEIPPSTAAQRPEAAAGSAPATESQDGSNQSSSPALEPETIQLPGVLTAPAVSLEVADVPASWRSAPAPLEPEDEAALLKRAKLAWEGGDRDLALATSQRCLELFPRSLAGLQLTAGLLTQLEHWDQLAVVYEQLLRTPLDVDVQVKLRVALSRVYASKLNAPETALQAIERACELQPKNATVHLEAAALCEVNGQIGAAEGHYRTTLKLEPLEARSYRRAAAFFSWSKDFDAAWNTAAILNYLGQANEREIALVESRRVQNLPQLVRPLAESDYLLGLSASATDPALSQLLGFLATPARKLRSLSPKKEQSLLLGFTEEQVEGSTTTLARTLGWAASLLGVKAPLLYLTDEPNQFAPLALAEPTWLVSRSFGRGKSAQELVFYWARSLSQLRPESRVLMHVPTQNELLTLLESCYAVTSAHSPEFDDTKRLSRELAKVLDKAEIETLRLKLAGLPYEKLQARLEAWLLQRAQAANRLGLVACGDPELAARALTGFSAATSGNNDSQLEDLFAFAVSDSYARLRKLLGVSVNAGAAAQ